MACQIANVAWRIKNRPGKAVRVTATRIGREMGKQSLLEQWLWPKVAVCEMFLDDFSKSFVGNGNETANVIRIIAHNSTVKFENVHALDRWRAEYSNLREP